MTSNWLFWIGGGVVGVAGLWLCYWAMFADRAKGRKRCPKCWYNMQAAENLRCPECGKSVKTERKLLKTRCRWRWAFVSLLLLLGSYILEVTPRYRKSEWRENSSTSLLVLHAYLFDDPESFSIVHLRSGSFWGYGVINYFPEEEKLDNWQWRVMMSYVLRQLGKLPDGVPDPQIFYFLSGGTPYSEIATEEMSSLLADSTDEEASAFFSMLDRTISLNALLPNERRAWVNTLVNALEKVDTQSKITIVYALSYYGYESVIAVPQLLDLLNEEDVLLRHLAVESFGDIVTDHLIIWDVFEDDKYNSEIDEQITLLLSQAGTSYEEIVKALIDVLESDESENIQIACARTLCQLSAGSPLAHEVIVEHLNMPDGPPEIILYGLQSVNSQERVLLITIDFILNNPHVFPRYSIREVEKIEQIIFENDSP